MKDLTVSKLKTYYKATQSIVEVYITHMLELESTIKNNTERMYFHLYNQYSKGGLLANATLGNAFADCMVLQSFGEGDFYDKAVKKLASLSKTKTMGEFLEVMNLFKEDELKRYTKQQLSRVDLLSELIFEQDASPEEMCKALNISLNYTPDAELYKKGMLEQSSLLKQLGIA